MKGHRCLVTLLAVFCVICGCPCVEGTFEWFTGFLSRLLPPLTRPEKCGRSMFIGRVDNSTYNFTVIGLPPVDNLTLLPHVEGSVEEKFSPLDSGIPLDSGNELGFYSPDHPRPWLVSIGNTSAGVLISPRHVITLARCVTDFMTWYGGFFGFTVSLLDQKVGVPRVQMKTVEEYPYSIALLTLSRHNLAEATAVCVGDYREGPAAAVVTWNMTEGRPITYPVTVHPRSQCESYGDGFRHDLMLCSSRGPMVCGSPLLQEDSGRWLLVGLAYGAVGEAATYVHLGPFRQMLGL